MQLLTSCVLWLALCFVTLSAAARAQDIDYPICGTVVPGWPFPPSDPKPYPWANSIDSKIIGLLTPANVSDTTLNKLGSALGLTQLNLVTADLTLGAAGQVQPAARLSYAIPAPQPGVSREGILIGLQRSFDVPVDITNLHIGMDLFQERVDSAEAAIIGAKDLADRWWWVVDLPVDPINGYARYNVLGTMLDQTGWTSVDDAAFDLKSVREVVFGVLTNVTVANGGTTGSKAFANTFLVPEPATDSLLFISVMVMCLCARKKLGRKATLFPRCDKLPRP